jgi:hypothetical protein
MAFSDFLAGLSKPPAPPAATPAPPPAPAANAPSPALAPDAGSAGVAPIDPLAKWGDLFKPTPPPAPGTQPPAPAADLWAVNPQQLAKAAEGINLASVIPQELATKALGGDVASFMEVINKSTQMAFMLAHQSAMQGVKPAVDARFSSLEKEMPSTFKKLSVDATLQGDPLLSNPVMAPVVEGMRAQILSKHPDATPQEVQKAISEYLKSIGIAVTPAGTQQSSKDAGQGSSKEVDWDNFL